MYEQGLLMFNLRQINELLPPPARSRTGIYISMIYHGVPEVFSRHKISLPGVNQRDDFTTRIRRWSPYHAQNVSIFPVMASALQEVKGFQ